MVGGEDPKGAGQAAAGSDGAADGSADVQMDRVGESRPRAPRRMSFGVMFMCYGAVQEVEDWLDAYCEGEYSLGIEEMDEDLVKKELKILFELEADKLRFIEDYVGT